MKKKIVRSPFFYVGDKYKLIEEISSYFPDDIEKFVEAFVGGGSVFMNIDARKFYLNDIDVNVIALHKFLCKSANKRTEFFSRIESLIAEYGLSYSYKEDRIPVEFKRQYKKTYYAKYNKEAYGQMKRDFNESSVADLYVLYLLLIYGFNRMLRFNKNGDFNLVYLDPPYLITFSEYNKLWNEQDEIELLQLLDSLNKRRIRFAISNVTHYKGRCNNLFIDWACKYNVHPIKSNYISYHDNSTKQISEVLITNY